MNLKNKLLSIRGNNVNLPTFEFYENDIVKRGKVWYSNKTRVVLEKGDENQCHKNTSELWNLNKDNFKVYIVSGYALIDDDESTWLQHSWLLLKEDDKDMIIETTLVRDVYFGYILNEVESDDFFVSNY